jgi:hypothetical protein
MDPEFREVTMQDAGANQPTVPVDVLQQILTELRDFRREFKDGTIYQQDVESANARLAEANLDGNDGQPKSNHPLPPIPPNRPDQSYIEPTAYVTPIPRHYSENSSVSALLYWARSFGNALNVTNLYPFKNVSPNYQSNFPFSC